MTLAPTGPLLAPLPPDPPQSDLGQPLLFYIPALAVLFALGFTFKTLASLLAPLLPFPP